MYELLNAKLLIMPDWLELALEAFKLKPKDIETIDGLGSILSEDDVRFYKKQVSDLVFSSVATQYGETPISALFSSLPILHTISEGQISGGSQLQEYVKINALYGTEFARHDFFGKINMLSYLPRTLGAALSEDVKVDPYLEYVGNDLYVLKFTTGLYPTQHIGEEYPTRAKAFLDSSLKCLIGNSGFDKVAGTKLFDLYTLVP